MLEEWLKIRDKKTKLSGKKNAILKLFFVLVSALIVFFPFRMYAFSALSLIFAGVLIYSGAGIFIAEMTMSYLMTVGSVYGISIFFGGDTERLIVMSLYAYSTSLALLLFVTTTSNKDLELLIGRENSIVYLYSFLFYFANLLYEIIAIFEARGYEPKKYKFWSYVPLLVVYFYNLKMKIDGVMESIEARGVE
jgi:hypothetical protein